MFYHIEIDFEVEARNVKDLSNNYILFDVHINVITAAE